MQFDRAGRIAIGIRLGQRWCSVSAIEDGKITDLIHKIPSLVTFTPNKAYYGAEAIRHSIQNISNSIYQFFGLLGKKFKDKSVQQLIKHCTYDLIKIDRSKMTQIPKFELIDEDIGIPIQFNSDTPPHIYSVIQIVSQFLAHILKESSNKIGCPVSHVAISIPNTFGQSQRLALMQAAKLVNIDPLRLVTSCMAASVCLRYYQQRNMYQMEDDGMDEKKSEYDDEKQQTIETKNGLYSKGKIKNGKLSSNHYNMTANNKIHRNGNSKRQKLPKNREVYLIADLSNIACSLSIIECKKRKYTDLIKVQRSVGSIEYGIWRMINAFSLYVVKSFVDGYKGFIRPNMQSSQMNNNKSKKRIESSSKSNKKKKNHKFQDFAESVNKYNYKNDIEIYDELQHIESIEKSELEFKSNDLINSSKSNPKTEDEALKCRFRSQVLCDTIIEHLHDQYANEEVTIHYEKFYRSFSLQLILTTSKLYEIALNPFLFNMINDIDKLLQESPTTTNKNGKKGKKKGKRRKIDQCFLVGDGGQIPQVVSLFSQFFDLNIKLADQPIVARGCAIVCAVDQELIPQPISLDLLPKSIRMEDKTNRGNLCLIIEAQSPCPCKKTVTRYTYKDNQTSYRIRFYEGESNNPRMCEMIGVFEIRRIEKRPKRDTKIVIAVHIDRNCIFVVSAEDVSSKPPVQLNVVKLGH